MSTTFRALVMLAVLVGLPAAWIYYGPLPDGAQRVVDRLVAAAKEAVGWENPPVRRAKSRQVESMAPAWSAPPFTEKSLVVPNSPVAPDPALAGQPSPSNVAPQVGALVPQAKGAATLAAAMEPLLARLRQLGAVEYALERWGQSGQLYRFRCAMPLAGRDATQEFEAIAETPGATVEQVVAEVTSWRLARQPGATALQ